jgi:hypothetical protein
MLKKWYWKNTVANAASCTSQMTDFVKESNKQYVNLIATVSLNW